MNPHLEEFIKTVAQLDRRLIVRSNLVILLEPEYAHFVDVYVDNKVEVVTSLPGYVPQHANRQRGNDFFEHCVEAIRLLNQRGDSKEGTDLVLDIVNNPVGAYLPGSQTALESEYRRR